MSPAVMGRMLNLTVGNILDLVSNIVGITGSGIRRK